MGKVEELEEIIALMSADLEALSSALKKVILLQDCPFYSKDGYGEIRVHDTEDEAVADARGDISQALSHDRIWLDGVEEIEHGILIPLSETLYRVLDRPPPPGAEDCREYYLNFRKERPAILEAMGIDDYERYEEEKDDGEQAEDSGGVAGRGTDAEKGAG